MGVFRKDEPLTAAVVRSFDRIPDRPVQAAILDGELWNIYRCVPEVHYAVNQQARLVGRLDWRMEIDSRELDTDGPAGSDEILRRAFGSDLRGITVKAAIHLQVVGRFFLVRVGRGDSAVWKILNSPHSVDQKADAENATIIIEVLTEDPAIRGRSDSPVRAVRDVATELMLARAQARGAYRSRIAQSKVVMYPKEGAGPDTDKFERDLIKVATQPMSDEKSTSAAVPNIFGWTQDSIDKWRVLDFAPDIDEKLHERIDRLIRQLAIGLDIAPTVLLGMEDSNHWSAYASQEDNWLGHVEPLAAPIGQALAEALAKAIDLGNPDRLEVIPDPAPLLRRRPAISDVITAGKEGFVTAEWVAEQLGAPKEAVGSGIPQPDETIQVESSETRQEPVIEASEQRQITTGQQDTPTAAANGPLVNGERLANIDEQAYNSFEDLIMDVAERVLERLGAKIRSMAQGRNIDLPRDVSNAELARLFTGEIPNSDATIDDTARAALARVARIIHRAQGQLRALGVEVESLPPDQDPQLSAAQEAFVAAVAAVVAAQQDGDTGIEQAWEASRQIATIAGGGGGGADFLGAASGIALAASTMALIRRDLGLAPSVGPQGYRWLHRYQGPNPHPVHLSLKDALYNGVSVFAAGFEAFPGDHTGCKCIVVPARFINVRTGWSQIQPNAPVTPGEQAA